MKSIAANYFHLLMSTVPDGPHQVSIVSRVYWQSAGKSIPKNNRNIHVRTSSSTPVGGNTISMKSSIILVWSQCRRHAVFGSCKTSGTSTVVPDCMTQKKLFSMYKQSRKI